MKELEKYLTNVIRGKNLGQISFNLVGRGDSGKSTILKFIDTLMTGLVGTSSLKALFGGAFGSGLIINKRLLVDPEIQVNSVPTEAIEGIKNLLGDAGITYPVNIKNKAKYTIKLKDLFMISASNSLYKVSVGNDGFYRRIRCLIMNKQIPTAEQIDLDKLIEPELDALFTQLAFNPAYHFRELEEQEDKGLTKNEVTKTMGPPNDKITFQNGETWFYNKSSISFKKTYNLINQAQPFHFLWTILGFIIYPILHIKRQNKISKDFSA
jgi:hypothetical protein